VLPTEPREPPPDENGGWWRRHLAAHHGRLIRINDTPHSVALGSAVGMFFGFTPLFGLKTLLSILVAWIFKSNKIAAAVTVTLHDLILPAAPVILYWEYQVGSFILHGRWPRAKFRSIALRDYMEWTTFFTLGKPTLIGSLFLALPSAIVVYFAIRGILTKARESQPEVVKPEAE
jgi:uncharacterized protein (DUF2062 family)